MSTRRAVDIVYVYGQALPNKAANSAAVISLCSAWAAAGRAVTIISPDEPGSEPERIAEVYAPHHSLSFRQVQVPNGSMRYPTLAAITLRSLSSRSTVVTRMPQLATLTALLRARTVLELHQGPATYKHWRYWRRLLRLVPAGRLRIVTNTRGIVDDLDPLLRGKFGEASVLPSAARNFGDHSSIPARYDVGFIGSYMPGKGVGFVERIATIADDRNFVIYGDPSKDMDTTERLRRLPNVTLAGYVSPSEVGPALASFQVGLAPYDRAGFGGQGSAFIRADDLSSLKVVEYMSAGRAVLASRISSVEQMIEDGKSGILCDPDDIHEWKRALDQLFAEPGLRKTLAANARQRYEQEFSYEVRASRFLTLIDAFDY